jgi:S1-C subfamily serine protease
VGDRIHSVNGQDIHSLDDAQRSIYGSGVGDRLTLGIERGAQRLTLVLTLVEAPRRGS